MDDIIQVSNYFAKSSNNSDDLTGFAVYSGVTKFATTFVFVVQLFAFTVTAAWVRSTLIQY